MRCRSVRRAERYLGLAVAAGLSSVAVAQETQTGLLVSAGGSVESNPYNEANVDGAQVAATAELRPWLRTRDENTTIDLSGSAQFRQFFKRYGLEDSYGADVGIVTRASERLTLRTNAAFLSSDGGYNGFGRPSLAPPGPTVPISEVPIVDQVPGIIDATILGQRNRTTSYDGRVGADTQINTFSRLSLDLTGRVLRFGATGFGDFNNVGAELAYTHQLSDRTSVGAITAVSRTDYIDAREGDARVVSVLGTIDRRIGTNWTLMASAGVSFTRSDQSFGLPDETFSAVTARVRFCQQAQYSQFCLNANRSPQPSANGDVRVANLISVDYSRRLSERDRVTFSAGYARTGKGRGLGPVANLPATEYATAAARFDRRLTERLTAFVSSSFSKIYTDSVSRDANLGVNAGVQVRFGALQ